LHFDRLDGSPVQLRPSNPPPLTGEVLHQDVFVTKGASETQLRHHAARVHPTRCRSKPSFHRMAAPDLLGKRALSGM
jgi:hypothetical protein